MISLRRNKKTGDDILTVIDKDSGKGRPTPTRKEAEASRPVQPYLRTKVSKGTSSTGGGDRKSGKAARREQFERQRTALRSGDTANLPLRDRGPERALTRDIVDARAGGVLSYFVFIAVVSLASSLGSNSIQFLGTTLMLAFAITAIGDAILLIRRVQNKVQAAHPSTTVRVKLYAIQRAVLPRRFRLPPPRVNRGQKL